MQVAAGASPYSADPIPDRLTWCTVSNDIVSAPGYAGLASDCLRSSNTSSGGAIVSAPSAAAVLASSGAAAAPASMGVAARAAASPAAASPAAACAAAPAASPAASRGIAAAMADEGHAPTTTAAFAAAAHPSPLVWHATAAFAEDAAAGRSGEHGDGCRSRAATWAGWAQLCPEVVECSWALLAGRWWMLLPPATSGSCNAKHIRSPCGWQSAAWDSMVTGLAHINSGMTMMVVHCSDSQPCVFTCIYSQAW